MKKYLTILFALISIAAFGKIYPDSDYAGSNVVNVAGPTWITITNGVGVNLTITNTITIISGGGLTTLTNQPPFTNGMLIPLMTSSNTPSGVVTTSSELVGYEGYKSLTRRPSDSWMSLSYGFVQYQFTNQVVATVFSWLTSSNVYGANQISVFGGGGAISYPLTNYTVTASNDGTNFTTLLTISTTNNQMNGYYQLNNSSAYSIYRVNNLTNIGQSDGDIFNWNLFNFSLPVTNLIPVQLTVQSNSYPSISGNTNSSELHVNSGISIDGNGDSKVGWSINGIPVQQGYAVSTNANSTVSSNSTSITTGTINYFVSCDSGIISLTNSAASIPPVFDSLDPNYFSHNALPAGATFTSSLYGYRYSSPVWGVYDTVVKGYYNQYPNYVGPVYRYYVYLPIPVASTTPVQSISSIDSLIAALKDANIWTNKLDLVLPFATGYVLCDGDNLLGLTNYPVSWFGSLSNSYSHTTNGIVAAGTNCYASVNWNYGTSFSGATPSNAFFGAWIVNQGSTNTQPLALFTDTNLNPNVAISASYWSNAASPFFEDGISSTNMEALSFPLPQTNDLWISVNRWTNALNSTYGNLSFTQSPTNQFNNSAPLFLIGNPTSTNSFGTIGMLIVGKGLSQQDQTNLAAIVAQFEFNMGRQQGQAGISQVTAPVQTSNVVTNGQSGVTLSGTFSGDLTGTIIGGVFTGTNDFTKATVAGVITNIGSILIYRNQTNINFTDLPTALSSLQAYDRLIIPAGSWGWIQPTYIPPNVTIEGVQNSTYIFYYTNCFYPTNFDVFSKLNLISTNFDASGGLQNGAFVINYGISNLLISSVNMTNFGNGLVDGATVGNPCFIRIEHCNWNGISRMVYAGAVDPQTIFTILDSTFSTYENTNFPYIKNCTLSISGGTNLVKNCVVTEDLMGLTQYLNGYENIAFFVGGGQCTIQNVLINPNGGCNRPMLIEGNSTYCILDASIPESYITYNPIYVATGFSGGDWTKLGINELGLQSDRSVNIQTNGFYDTSFTNNGFLFDGSAAGLAFYNKTIANYPQILTSQSFSNLISGPTNFVTLSNAYVAVCFYATNGLWVTNFSGIETVCTMSNKDILIVTNIGWQPINTFSFKSVIVTATNALSTSPVGQYKAYTNNPVGLFGTISSTFYGGWYGTSVTNWQQWTFYTGSGNAAITNFLVANIVGGQRGETFSLSTSGTSQYPLSINFHSNAWSLATATNGMVLWDNRITQSNGTLVDIYISNTFAPYVYTIGNPGGSIIP